MPIYSEGPSVVYFITVVAPVLLLGTLPFLVFSNMCFTFAEITENPTEEEEEKELVTVV